jgi:hypothetical protein
MAGACAGLIRGDTKAGAVKGSAATRTTLHDLAIIKCDFRIEENTGTLQGLFTA